MSNKLISILLVLTSLLIMAAFFGKVVWLPNRYMFTMGGDGYYIMHQIAYHTKYGEGLVLQSMNYPNYELIFLTDAQAIVSILTSWINRNLFDVSDYICGIHNGLLLYTLPIGVLFTWLSLKELKVNKWMSALFSLLIIFLSPQIHRLTTGHYGIAYVFFIPLILYWLIRYLNGRAWRIGPYLVGAILLVFGFNNPYLSLIGASLILSTALVLILNDWRQIREGINKAKQLLITALVPLVLIIAVIKLNDPVDDRVKAPFGYGANYATIESVFLPQYSFMYEKIQPFFNYQKTPWEGRSYIGLMSACLLAFMLVGWIRKRILIRGKKWSDWTSSSTINILFWASLLILLFSMNFLLYKRLHDVSFIPSLQQFRAPGRFAWIFYYVGSITAVYVLHEIWEQLEAQGKTWIGYGLLSIGTLLFMTDAYYYLTYLTDGNLDENHLSEQWLAPYSEQISKAKINRDDYQAIYMLPATHFWSDKVGYETNFRSEMNAFAISLSTGIPFLNAWLSRMSISQTLHSVQTVSHPLIQKEFDKVPLDNRPILVLTSREAKLEEGESYLLAHSDTIVNTDQYTLLSFLPFESQVDTFWQNAQRDYQYFNAQNKEPIFRESFEDSSNEVRFYGKGAKSLKAGVHLLGSITLDVEIERNQMYECSIWCYVDQDYAGLPWVSVKELSASGEILQQHRKWASRSKDVQDGWARSSQRFQLNALTTSIQFFIDYGYPAIVDELQFNAITDTSMIRLADSKDFLYNNFKINLSGKE